MTLLEMMEPQTMTQTPASIVPTETPTRDLSQRTLCLVLKFHTLGNSRKVKTSQIQTDADEDSVKVSKVLLASPELEAIRKADREFTAAVDDIALPYDVGARLIPADAVEQVYNDLEEYSKVTRPALVEAFMEVYAQRKAEAPARLASLHNADDYPPEHKVREAFGMEYKFVVFGEVPPELRSISGRIFDQERNKMAAHLENVEQEIAEAMRLELVEAVSHLQDRLTPETDGSQKILHKTTVTHLQEFLDNWTKRKNAVNYPELNAEVEKLRAMMKGASKERLKESESFRRRLHQDLTAAAQTLEVIRKPTRRFKGDD